MMHSNVMSVLNVFFLTNFIFLYGNVNAVKVISTPTYNDQPEKHLEGHVNDDTIREDTSETSKTDIKSENIVTELAEQANKSEKSQFEAVSGISDHVLTTESTVILETNGKNEMTDDFPKDVDTDFEIANNKAETLNIESDILENEIKTTENGILKDVKTVEETALVEPENLARENTQGAPVFKPNTKSSSISSTDFEGTLLCDLMQNENGRVLVSAFLNAFTRTMENSVSSSIYLHISRQVKNLFKDPNASQSISIISSTYTNLLTNEIAYENLSAIMQNFKTTSCKPETVILVEKLNELTTSLFLHPNSRRVIRVFGTGILSLLQLPDPKAAIIKSFQDLRSYTWK